VWRRDHVATIVGVGFTFLVRAVMQSWVGVGVRVGEGIRGARPSTLIGDGASWGRKNTRQYVPDPG
jgi:hypothetical protein